MSNTLISLAKVVSDVGSLFHAPARGSAMPEWRNFSTDCKSDLWVALKVVDFGLRYVCKWGKGHVEFSPDGFRMMTTPQMGISVPALQKVLTEWKNREDIRSQPKSLNLGKENEVLQAVMMENFDESWERGCLLVCEGGKLIPASTRDRKIVAAKTQVFTYEENVELYLTWCRTSESDILQVRKQMESNMQNGVYLVLPGKSGFWQFGNRSNLDANLPRMTAQEAKSYLFKVSTQETTQPVAVKPVIATKQLVLLECPQVPEDLKGIPKVSMAMATLDQDRERGRDITPELLAEKALEEAQSSENARLVRANEDCALARALVKQAEAALAQARYQLETAESTKAQEVCAVVDAKAALMNARQAREDAVAKHNNGVDTLRNLIEAMSNL